MACLTSFAFVGCAAESTDNARQGDDQNVTSSSELSFRPQGSPSVSNPLVSGTRMTIKYDASRLPDCRAGLPNGKPAWTITGFASTNGSAAQRFQVAGFNPDPTASGDAAIDLPESGDLAVWFQVTNNQGCSKYDSDFGKNYHFNVGKGAPQAQGSIAWQKSGSPSLSGRAAKGGTIELVYPADRLPQCRMNLNGGGPGWTLTAYTKVNGREPESFRVAGHNPGGPDRGNPKVNLPESGKLAVWFQVTNIQGCSEYDSQRGANYTFDIQ